VLILGIALLVVAGLVTVAVIQSGDDPVRVDAAFVSVHTNGLALFLAGAISLALVAVGLLLVRVGVRKARRRRREMNELRRRAFEATPTPTTGSGRPGGDSTSPGRSARPPDADDHFDTTPRD